MRSTHAHIGEKRRETRDEFLHTNCLTEYTRLTTTLPGKSCWYPRLPLSSSLPTPSLTLTITTTDLSHSRRAVPSLSLSFSGSSYRYRYSSLCKRLSFSPSISPRVTPALTCWIKMSCTRWRQLIKIFWITSNNLIAKII